MVPGQPSRSLHLTSDARVSSFGNAAESLRRHPASPRSAPRSCLQMRAQCFGPRPTTNRCKRMGASSPFILRGRCVRGTLFSNSTHRTSESGRVVEPKPSTHKHGLEKEAANAKAKANCRTNTSFKILDEDGLLHGGGSSRCDSVIPMQLWISRQSKNNDCFQARLTGRQEIP